MLRIGVDVGGTNTDAVLIDASRRAERGRGVLAQHKTSTTVDVSEGIETAVKAVLGTANAADVTSLTIGTTAFINAVLERDERRLQKVAVIRICGPYTQQCPPFLDFPPDLRQLVEGHVGYVDGGFQIDGREIKPLSETQIVEECKKIKSLGIKAVAFVGVYSALDREGAHEEAARAIAVRELGPSANVVCSREVGQVGLLERENATILNASILAFAQRTIRGFKHAMHRLHLSCPLFLTQNDGTLTTAGTAARLPIRTFASGPANSMRGASFLAGLDVRPEAERKPCIVVDVGGTTTDVGVLLPSGFPRQAAAYIEVGGVRTNFSMPDVQSIGLGGGSHVRIDNRTHRVTVGPDSVGHDLTKDAIVFGGKVLTASDIIVAAGAGNLGDASMVRGKVDAKTVGSARERIRTMLEEVIDRMKTSPEPATVLLVGGGAIIAPRKLDGVAELISPPCFDVANAVGAAMAKVSGEVDTIEILEGRTLPEVVEGLKAQAIQRAIAAGADAATTEVVEITNLPVQYVTNQATRLIVKAVGELSSDKAIDLKGSVALTNGFHDEEPEPPKRAAAQASQVARKPVDIATYEPRINKKREWEVSELDLEWIAEGCGVLGTGGGGAPYPPMLMVRECLRRGKTLRIIDGADAPRGARFIRCNFMGAPSVSLERIQGGKEIPTAITAVLKQMNLDDVYGTAADEIGGGNGLQPMITAANLNKPVLDVDFMGRAFPNLDQILPATYKIENAICPTAIADAVGNVVVMPAASNYRYIEHALRGVCTVMGSKAAHIGAPLTREQCQRYGVQRSVSQAWWLGRALALCRKNNDLNGVPKAILQLQTGRCLFVGKIVGVEREVKKGFTWGEVTIVPLKDSEQETRPCCGRTAPEYPVHDPDEQLVIPFQNEYIYAYLRKPDGSERVLVTVPDLITVLDSQSGGPLGTPDLRYGLRVTVLALAADPKWSRNPIGLASGGPRFFGLNMDYVPVGGEYREPVSVIDRFA